MPVVNGKPMQVSGDPRRFSRTYLLKRHSFARKGKNGKGAPFGVICYAEFYPIQSHWVFYPKREHIPIFYNASLQVKRGGLAEDYQGSVGSLELWKKHGVVDSERKEWVITYVQAHFRTGRPAQMTRGIATYYGGWRHHLLSAVFGEAKKEGAAMLLDISGRHGVEPQSELVHPDLSASERERRKVFIQVAEENSFTVEKDKSANYLVATSKP
ncbi:Uncharacterised protein [uncultured archaeon]|nr:Uncharacterised protein [uncultured archaeon]